MATKAKAPAKKKTAKKRANPNGQLTKLQNRLEELANNWAIVRDAAVAAKTAKTRLDDVRSKISVTKAELKELADSESEAAVDYEDAAERAVILGCDPHAKIQKKLEFDPSQTTDDVGPDKSFIEGVTDVIDAKPAKPKRPKANAAGVYTSGVTQVMVPLPKPYTLAILVVKRAENKWQSGFVLRSGDVDLDWSGDEVIGCVRKTFHVYATRRESISERVSEAENALNNETGNPAKKAISALRKWDAKYSDPKRSPAVEEEPNKSNNQTPVECPECHESDIRRDTKNGDNWRCFVCDTLMNSAAKRIKDYRK